MKIFISIYQFIKHRFSLLSFNSSEKYWINRYKEGGNSGYGSYCDLAQYKADVLNEFIEQNKINTVIEYGCGDGNQLKLVKYSHYVGFDISPVAISLCKNTFKTDASKSFFLMKEYNGEEAELTLSLDVIYHLVEDDIYENHMKLLFNSSQKYIIIYSTNEDTDTLIAPHIKHRNITEWIRQNFPNWELVKHIPNKYSNETIREKRSKADFFIYRKLLVAEIIEFD